METDCFQVVEAPIKLANVPQSRPESEVGGREVGEMAGDVGGNNYEV